jgi:hypothetical protein
MTAASLAHTGKATRVERATVARKRRLSFVAALVVAGFLVALGFIGEQAGFLAAGAAQTLLMGATMVLVFEMGFIRAVPAAVDRDVMFSKRLPLRSLLDETELGEITPSEVADAVLYLQSLPADRISNAERWEVVVTTRSGLMASFDGLPAATLQKVQAMVTADKSQDGRKLITPAVWQMGKHLDAALAWVEDHKVTLRTVNR